MIDAFSNRFRRFLTLLLALGLGLVVSPAWAGGSIRLNSTNIDEVDGRWKLKVTIDYGSKPHLAHVPMQFSFTPVVLYERSITDDSPKTPRMRKVPLEGQEPINVPMDVGFSDASGTIYRITKFSVRLSRAASFEAGEYDLVVRLQSGATLGRRQRIYLTGDNKVIDRRSMDFSAPAPKPKSAKASQSPEDSLPPEPSGPMAAEDVGPDLSDIPDDDGTLELDAPPGTRPKQGGCGCRIAGERSLPAGWPAWASLALFGLLGWRRQRR